MGLKGRSKRMESAAWKYIRTWQSGLSREDLIEACRRSLSKCSRAEARARIVAQNAKRGNPPEATDRMMALFFPEPEGNDHA